MSDQAVLHHGDCLDVLRSMPDNSVDSVVTDPPYGLSFMAKRWDHDVPAQEVWTECLRVLKPGGHLLAFAGTRTQHRMAVRMEDAGFDIRDMIAWVYGSGFPKSHNLSGDWQGWGTALKPALEPITLARKPLTGTVAENVMEWGCGALNVDGCRVATDDRLGGGMVSKGRPKASDGWDRPWMHDPEITKLKKIEAAQKVATAEAMGRWPANLIHDGSDEVVGLFPDSKGAVSNGRKGKDGNCFGHYGAVSQKPGHADTGSAARFFYCAKASKSDRGPGNHHPTVKPTDLMRYLCRLVTPPNGVILDPFMGSGSTGKAALLEGFRFIGIERDPEYMKIAEARIAHAERPQHHAHPKTKREKPVRRTTHVPPQSAQLQLNFEAI